MMEQFFGFRNTPFERDIPTGQLYTTPKFDELLSRLEYAARNRKFSVIDLRMLASAKQRLFASLLTLWTRTASAVSISPTPR